MQHGTQDSNRQPKTKRPRIERRRAERQDRIVAIAARKFARSGLEGVALDEVADEADIARGTLYSHFPTKDALISAVVRPALVQGIDALKRVKGPGARKRVEGLLSVYVELWQEHADALRVAHCAQKEPPDDVTALHVEFRDSVMAILGAAQRARALRSGSAAVAAHILSRVAVPLLEIYGDQPNAAALFEQSMAALLLRE